MCASGESHHGRLAQGKQSLGKLESASRPAGQEFHRFYNQEVMKKKIQKLHESTPLIMTHNVKFSSISQILLPICIPERTLIPQLPISHSLPTYLTASQPSCNVQGEFFSNTNVPRALNYNDSDSSQNKHWNQQHSQVVEENRSYLYNSVRLDQAFQMLCRLVSIFQRGIYLNASWFGVLSLISPLQTESLAVIMLLFVVLLCLI